MLTTEDVATVPLFAELPPATLERLARTSADLRLSAGEFAVSEGGERALYAVLSGHLEVVKLFDGVERILGYRRAGTIFGEVPLALSSPFPAGYRAAEPSRVMQIAVAEYYHLAAAAHEVAAKVGALARERIGGLQSLSAETPVTRVTLVGRDGEAACGRFRHFLARNQISFDWLAPGSADLAAAWPDCPLTGEGRALVRLADGQVLDHPHVRDLARRLGLQTAPRQTEYDVAIVGGGPGGLAAAVYGASEGLRTLVIEREAPGGQAGTSSRIENYLGFPGGISGDELASRALQQAKRLGAEILVTREVAGLDPVRREVTLDGGDIVRARSLILATGVAWRRLPIEGLDRLVGKGVYYGTARSEAGAAHGLDVCLVGAGNSAGQAAIHLATHARQVTLLARCASLEESMSHYLIEQLETKPNIAVELNVEVKAVRGDAHLAEIDVLDSTSGVMRRRNCEGLFIFIGADAETDWLPPEIARDARGYVLTGDELHKAGAWKLARDPYLLETSAPGVFACGDVRLSPIKRVAAAVGEGSMAIAFVHRFLAAGADARPTSTAFERDTSLGATIAND
jgi:thioredoxin reductase (NADPH)